MNNNHPNVCKISKICPKLNTPEIGGTSPFVRTCVFDDANREEMALLYIN